MTISQQINMVAAYKGLSQADIARLIGTTPQNFNKKVKRGTFSREEMEQIAEALGATYTASFEFPDGTKI